MTWPTAACCHRVLLRRLRQEDWEDEDFAQVTYQAVKEHARTPFRDTVWEQLSEASSSYQARSTTTRRSTSWPPPSGSLTPSGHRRNYAFYLSIPPGAFPVVVQQLKRSGLSDSGGVAGGAW